MSDLQPHPRPYDISVDDPSVTRLVHRRADPSRSARLLTNPAGVATSVSVVVHSGGQAATETIERIGSWTPAGVRVEMLLVEEPDGSGRAGMRDLAARSGHSWRVTERPMGGRCAALAAAAATVEHEFVMVTSGGEPPFEEVTSALCHMWSEGCDAALLGPADDSTGPGTVLDASDELAAWFGLRGATVPGRLVVTRRWAARWLFNELPRAIDPGEEIADRARLLGMGIVRIAPS
jgi:hypothetical protein